MSTLAYIYASAVIDGDRTYNSLPKQIKPLVKEILIKQGLENLVTE